MSFFALDDAEARAAESSFAIPDIAMRERLLVGDLVKLIFVQSGGAAVERMWVEVTSVTERGYQGRLDNDPTQIPGLSAGEVVAFEPRHIMSVWVDANHDWAARMVEIRHPFTRSKP
jgi:uncharacterized protein YegJ (DUF2314 family)